VTNGPIAPELVRRRTSGSSAKCAFDPLERSQAGHRSREWTAVADGELGVVREMARCLREIREGRVPQ
jgi:hypothetical protein